MAAFNYYAFTRGAWVEDVPANLGAWDEERPWDGASWANGAWANGAFSHTDTGSVIALPETGKLTFKSGAVVDLYRKSKYPDEGRIDLIGYEIFAGVFNTQSPDVGKLIFKGQPPEANAPSAVSTPVVGKLWFKGGEPDAAGSTLKTLATGKLLFKGYTPTEVRAAITSDPVVGLLQFVGGEPNAGRIVGKAAESSILLFRGRSVGTVTGPWIPVEAEDDDGWTTVAKAR